MNSDTSPGAALKSLLAQHGQQLAFDPDTTLSLLSEACPNSGKEVEAIVAAQRLRIPWELLNSGVAVDPARLEDLSKTLSEQGNMPQDAAKWIIQTWVKALDVSIAEGQNGAPQPAAPASPPDETAGQAAAVTPVPQPDASQPTGYYVVGDGGAKYGPADVPTLNQWIQENRLNPGSMLEDAATGQSLAAQNVPGLTFSAAQQQPQHQAQQAVGQAPYGQIPGAQVGPGMRPEQPGGMYAQAPQQYAPYPQQGYVRPETKRMANAALIKSILAIIPFIMCWPMGIVALIFAIIGKSAVSSRDPNNESKVNTANIISNIALGISVVLTIGYIIAVVFVLSNSSPAGRPVPGMRHF